DEEDRDLPAELSTEKMTHLVSGKALQFYLEEGYRRAESPRSLDRLSAVRRGPRLEPRRTQPARDRVPLLAVAVCYEDSAAGPFRRSHPLLLARKEAARL